MGRPGLQGRETWQSWRASWSRGRRGLYTFTRLSVQPGPERAGRGVRRLGSPPASLCVWTRHTLSGPRVPPVQRGAGGRWPCLMSLPRLELTPSWHQRLLNISPVGSLTSDNQHLSLLKAPVWFWDAGRVQAGATGHDKGCARLATWEDFSSFWPPGCQRCRDVRFLGDAVKQTLVLTDLGSNPRLLHAQWGRGPALEPPFPHLQAGRCYLSACDLLGPAARF